MKIVKKILVPTDFSPAADVAITYAMSFAEVIEADVVLYHAFTPLMSGFYPVALNQMENLELENKLIDRLSKIQEHFSKTHPMLTITIQVDKGPSKTRILDYCKKKKIGLIVMGTKGANGLAEGVLGSFTSSIMTSATCPVLAIPLTGKFKMHEQITYATNYQKGDVLSINFLLQINECFNAKIKVVHVDQKDDSREAKKIAFNKYVFKLKKHVLHENISFKQIGGKDLVEALLTSTLKDKTDLLVISHIKEEGLFTSLFHKSITKAIACKIHMPLLSIPIAIK